MQANYKEIKIVLKINTDNIFHSLIVMDDYDAMTIEKMIDGYRDMHVILNHFEQAMLSLRERFHDYLYEIADDNDVISFIDAIRRGSAKQRDDWQPAPNAQDEINDWEASIKDKE